MAPTAYAFGDGFRFEPENQRLVHHGQAVPLTGKSADTLLVLVEHAETLVTKEALMTAVWPGLAVEENNLNQQISAVRKALAHNGGSDLIETVPRRGYRFTAPVRQVDPGSIPAPPSGHTMPARRHSRVWLSVGVAGVVIAAAAVASWMWYQGRRDARESASALERGRALMRAGNAKGAVTELQDAIRLAPGNAQAHSTLAHALNTLAYTDTSSTRRAIGQSPSVAAAERGAALDPSCGPCHGTLGFFLFYHDWQWTRAETHLREAIRLSPDEESIRPSYAMLLSATGRQAEALAEIDLALQKQPYQAGWRVIRTSILYLSRRYADAVAAADETLLIARQRGAWEWRSKALFQLDRGAEAVNAMAQDVFAAHSADLDRAVREDGPEAGLRTLLSLTDDWRGRVEHSWRRGPWRAILGDTDGALEEVERAYEARRLNAIYLGVDPVYDRIRSHPRFQKVLTDMGLTAVLR